jgi:N-acetylglucosaminyl-diphospho-decaprenol L-rhamnosyltransferase
VPPRVSVIVVSFNTREYLRRSLESIESHHEVIVVDNGSTDGSPEMVRGAFPAVRLIEQENLGFGCGNNAGLAVATGELALLLNSDAEAKPGAIDRLADSLESGIVAAGGRLENPDGSLQESACSALTLWAVFCEQTYLEKLFPGSRLFSPYWQSSRMPEGGDVDQVMGACLMMRRVAGKFLEFNPRFFLYCEDTELCRRLIEHGLIRYVPAAVFTHHLGQSTPNRWRSVRLYNAGKELYFEIHHGPAAAILSLLLNRFGALLRILAGLLVTAKARTFWRVLCAPLNWRKVQSKP